jgi:hypothetical protein
MRVLCRAGERWIQIFILNKNASPKRAAEPEMALDLRQTIKHAEVQSRAMTSYKFAKWARQP